MESGQGVTASEMARVVWPGPRISVSEALEMMRTNQEALSRSGTGLKVTTVKKARAHPLRPRVPGPRPVGPFGLHIWPGRCASQAESRVPVARPGTSYHGPPCPPPAPLSDLLKRMPGAAWLLRLSRFRMRGRRMQSALEDVTWPLPVFRSRWKPRRPFDHDRDRWE